MATVTGEESDGLRQRRTERVADGEEPAASTATTTATAATVSQAHAEAPAEERAPTAREAEGSAGSAGVAEGSAAAGEAAEGDPELFKCTICLDRLSEPVATRCGHVFCWPCLHDWLEMHGTCPVCKAGVPKDSVIPLYGGSKGPDQARGEAPPRPQAERPPPPPEPMGFPFGMHHHHHHAHGHGNHFRAFFGLPFLGVGMNFNGGLHFQMNAGLNRERTPEERAQEASNSWMLIGLVALLIFIFFL